MRKCVYCKCPNDKGKKMSCHRFPTDLKERSRWLQNMNASNWTPKKFDFLCSKHFEINCFIKHYNRTTLKLGSIPTIFEGSFEDATSCKEQLSLTDSNNVSGEKEMDVEELKPVGFTYPYQYAITASSASESTGTNSLSRRQLPKQREIKRLLSESNLEDNNMVQEDASTTGKLKREIQDNTRIDHNCGVSGRPKKSRIEYGVAHDHCYESSNKSLKKAAQRTKRSLNLAKTRVKVLTRRVKKLKIKVNKLKTVINDLNQRNKVSEEC